jgi:hypothetical protein
MYITVISIIYVKGSIEPASSFLAVNNLHHCGLTCPTTYTAAIGQRAPPPLAETQQAKGWPAL